MQRQPQILHNPLLTPHLTNRVNTVRKGNYPCVCRPRPVLIGIYLLMKKNARIFNCCRCRKLVALCSHCDRGNIYCSKTCAHLSRKESLQRSGKKYQQSRKGRLKHAECQHRYRERQRQKVTHHSSPPMSLSGLLRHASKLRTSSLSNTSPIPSEKIICADCGEVCSPFLRLTTLGGRSPPEKYQAKTLNPGKRSKTIGHNRRLKSKNSALLPR